MDELVDLAQLMTQDREALHVGARVGDLHPAAVPGRDGKRRRQGGLHRAAPAERAAAVADPRQKPLLERIGDVGATGERPRALRASQQLERCLAVAVLEVLARQTVPMRREQQRSARARDERHRVAWV
jgi:hypothetical protein